VPRLHALFQTLDLQKSGVLSLAAARAFLGPEGAGAALAGMEAATGGEGGGGEGGEAGGDSVAMGAWLAFFEALPDADAAARIQAAEAAVAAKGGGGGGGGGGGLLGGDGERPKTSLEVTHQTPDTRRQTPDARRQTPDARLHERSL
jgi:hypothetical protein